MDSLTIRDALRQQPFKPFVMKLVDKRELVVRHPEFVAVSPRDLLYINHDNYSITWIEPLLVITIEFLSTPTGVADNGMPSN